jgi:hypothetical protein
MMCLCMSIFMCSHVCILCVELSDRKQWVKQIQGTWSTGIHDQATCVLGDYVYAAAGRNLFTGVYSNTVVQQNQTIFNDCISHMSTLFHFFFFFVASNS